MTVSYTHLDVYKRQVQYAYARAKSILRRAEGISKEVEYSKLSSKEEFELVKTLDNFKNQILLALDKLEPSIVTRYTIEVAKAFNKFYNAHSILNLEDEVLKATRLKLVEASAQVIKNGLDLLGIDAVSYTHLDVYKRQLLSHQL